MWSRPVAAVGIGRPAAAEQLAQGVRGQARFQQVVGDPLRRTPDEVADDGTAVRVGDRRELGVAAPGLVEAVVELLDERSEPWHADALLGHHVPAVVFSSASCPIHRRVRHGSSVRSRTVGIDPVLVRGSDGGSALP